MAHELLQSRNFTTYHNEASVMLGTIAATVLGRIAFWADHNEQSGSQDPDGEPKHFKEGFWWTYNTYAGWYEQFGGSISFGSVRRSINELEDLGLVISTDRFNQKAYDQTKWYRVDFDAYDEMVETWKLYGSPKWAGRTDKEAYAAFKELWIDHVQEKSTPVQDEQPPVHREHPPVQDEQPPLFRVNTSPVQDEQTYTSNTSKTTVKPSGASAHSGAQPTPGRSAARDYIPPRPRTSVVHEMPPSMSAKEESEPSALQVHIEQTTGSPLAKKYVKEIEKEYKSVVEGKTYTDPSAADLFADEPLYRQYVQKELDYWMGQQAKTGHPVRNYMKRLINSIVNRDRANYGFNAWSQGQGQGIPGRTVAEVEVKGFYNPNDD